MRTYRFIAALSPSIVRLESSEQGVQLWTLSRSRKEAQCKMCGGQLKTGDHTWRPITFQGNRMDRIGGDCIARLADKARERQR